MKRVTIWTKKKILYFEKHFKDEDHKLIDWSVIYRWHLKNPTVKQWPWTHHRTFFRQPFTVVTISPTLKRNTDTPDCRDICQTCQRTHTHTHWHTPTCSLPAGISVPMYRSPRVCVWSSAEHRRIRAQLVSLHVAPSPAAYSLPVTAEITWLWLHKTPSTETTERPGGSLMG